MTHNSIEINQNYFCHCIHVTKCKFFFTKETY